MSLAPLLQSGHGVTQCQTSLGTVSAINFRTDILRRGGMGDLRANNP